MAVRGAGDAARVTNGIVRFQPPRRSLLRTAGISKMLHPGGLASDNAAAQPARTARRRPVRS